MRVPTKYSKDGQKCRLTTQLIALLPFFLMTQVCTEPDKIMSANPVIVRPTMKLDVTSIPPNI
jgi:hypothetical protein